MSGFADGGTVSGPDVTVLVRSVGPCVNGHPLYSIEGVVQHIIPSALIRRGDAAEMLACQKALEDEATSAS